MIDDDDDDLSAFIFCSDDIEMNLTVNIRKYLFFSYTSYSSSKDTFQNTNLFYSNVLR